MTPIDQLKSVLCDPEDKYNTPQLVSDEICMALATPPHRKPLTDDEMEAIFIKCGGEWNGDFWKIEDANFHPFLRTIEAKLKGEITIRATQLTIILFPFIVIGWIDFCVKQGMAVGRGKAQRHLRNFLEK
jgi:hypothetical protein